MCPSEVGNAANTSSYAGCHHDREAPIDSDNNGVLFLNSKIRYKDITDGVAFTLFIGEKVTDQNDLGWMSGTRATLRNTGVIPPPTNAPAPSGATTASTPVDEPAGPDADKVSDGESTKPAEQPPSGNKINPILYIGPFSSYHSGGIVNFGFGDGSVRALGSIDPKAYRRMGNRADGELVETDAF
jgi:prepilin-type processing-associated H-X9-DG protein